jgi:hypothetical protein
MAELDRTTARALVEAGYMPLAHYIEMFGEDAPGDRKGESRHVPSPATAPEVHDDEPVAPRKFAGVRH